ncbi:MAG: hypothetical protein HYT30_01060 [Parcubacteria group bacterium]|nr:hypothetical protein [Parcubacteria group bacterium]
MTQTTLIRRRGRLYAFSFTTGTKPIEPKVRVTDDTIQAECLRLTRQGKIDESNALLDRYYPPR